ncbi:MAG: hypothetical protein QME46_11925 [Thermoanaerobacteraceae bacterium]|nr:hypothetical protein [Thermoanaerobacteraceae bacterium]
MTSSYRELDIVCRALNLTYKKTKKGHMWYGFINNNMVRIVIHEHAQGRDIPTGTFNQYLKLLGFANVEEYNDFLTNVK